MIWKIQRQADLVFCIVLTIVCTVVCTIVCTIILQTEKQGNVGLIRIREIVVNKTIEDKGIEKSRIHHRDAVVTPSLKAFSRETGRESRFDQSPL